MKTLFSVLLIFAAAFIASCLEDEAQPQAQTGGVSQAAFDALLARVVALEANQPGDKVYAAAQFSGAFKAASAVGQPLGTMIGHLPAGVAVTRSEFFSLRSPAGYLYAVSNARNENGFVGIATYAGNSNTGGSYVYFSTDNCSSAPANVPATEISDYGASQGLVFMVGAGEFNEVIDNPDQYFYIPAGTPRNTNISYASRMAKTGHCEAASGILPASYVALPNDPIVTGVNSAPIAAPATLANP